LIENSGTRDLIYKLALLNHAGSGLFVSHRPLYSFLGLRSYLYRRLCCVAELRGEFVGERLEVLSRDDYAPQVSGQERWVVAAWGTR
jgi:hypothetical protein